MTFGPPAVVARRQPPASQELPKEGKAQKRKASTRVTSPQETDAQSAASEKVPKLGASKTIKKPRKAKAVPTKSKVKP